MIAQDAARQELAELRQIVFGLAKQVGLLEGRSRSIEEIIAGKPPEFLFPLHVEEGMLLDNEEMKRRIGRVLDERPIEVRP